MGEHWDRPGAEPYGYNVPPLGGEGMRRLVG